MPPIATEVDLAIGRTDGVNCKGEEKVQRFMERYPGEKIQSFQEQMPLVKDDKVGYFILTSGKICLAKSPQQRAADEKR